MLGFRWMKSAEEATGVETYTEFRQDWPYVGQVSVSKVGIAARPTTCAPGRECAAMMQPARDLKYSITSYSCYRSGPAVATATQDCTLPWSPGQIFFPFASSSTENSWDLTGTALPTIVNIYTYSGYADQSGAVRQFGDPTQVVVDIYENWIRKQRKTTSNQYLPAKTDGQNWQNGRLSRAVVTSTQY